MERDSDVLFTFYDGLESLSVTCASIGEMAELMCDALPFAVNNGALIKKTWQYKIIESLRLEKIPQVISSNRICI